MTYQLAFTALADSTRRQLFESIRDRPSSVGELAAQFPISQPAVSQHLRVLRDAQLVTVQKLGARHIYHVEPEGLLALRTYLDGFWQDVLEAFRDSAQSPDHGDEQ